MTAALTPLSALPAPSATPPAGAAPRAAGPRAPTRTARATQGLSLLAGLLATAVAGFAAALPTAAHATSLASSASSAGSELSGSLSDSLKASSGSSSGDKKVAAGTYRIDQLAELEDKPTHLRLHLQATATAGQAGAVTLDLPRQAVARQGLTVDATIELRQRPYGMEVAATTTKTAFFLLLSDDWQADLHSRAVTL